MTTYEAKSVVISRKPHEKKEGTWSAFIGLFRENNPHLQAKEPFEVIEIENIEKVRLKELKNISFYLRGNDLVVNDLISITIKKTQEGIVTISGEQTLPEQ